MTHGAYIKADINSCGNEIEGAVFVVNAQPVQKPQKLALWQPVHSFRPLINQNS